MKKRLTHGALLFIVSMFVWVLGCVTTSGPGGGPQSASEMANQQADAAMYKPIVYANASKPGPMIIVLPGDIKSANA
ncbi:MAG: hypothetical protein JZU67_01735, partial [Burkholderiaceae bacterium]|nr:hypothetical protein [Burkholderiaceae bacterium]